MMTSETLWQGAVQQTLFRELLESFSRPGSVRELADILAGASALRALLATLMDGECSLADPHSLIASEDWPLLQARRGSPETARFVAVDGKKAPNFKPALGSLESPEFGATLLIAVDALGHGAQSLSLAGPGIDGECLLRFDGLHPDWLARRTDWTCAFPLGVDLLLIDATRIVALPRTTQIKLAAGVC